jgi:hypothetical protein
MDCLKNCKNNELTQITFTNNEYNLYLCNCGEMWAL